MTKTLPEYRKLVRLWQRRFGLQDTKITVRFARPGENTDEAHGWVHPCVDRGSAELVMDETCEYPEFIVMHELGHIVMGGVLTTGYPDWIEERVINRFIKPLAIVYKIPIPPRYR